MTHEVFRTRFSLLFTGKTSNTSHIANPSNRLRRSGGFKHQSVNSRTRFAKLVYLLVIGIATLGMEMRVDGQTVYELGSIGQLTVLDTETNAVTAEFLGLPCSPGYQCQGTDLNSLAVSQDGKTLYICGYTVNSSGITSGTLVIFDTLSQSVSNPISLGSAYPAGPIQITPDGKSLLIETQSPTPSGTDGEYSSYSTGFVIFDIPTGTVTETFSLPFLTYWSQELFWNGVAITPDSKFIYEISASNPTQVAIVDANTGDVTSTFTLNYSYTDQNGVQRYGVWSATRIAFSADGTKAYIEGAGGAVPIVGPSWAGLLELDIASTKASPVLDSGVFDGPIACGSNGYCYITTAYGGSAQIPVIDTNSNTVVQDIFTASLVTAAAVLTPDSHYLYLGTISSGTYVVDATLNEVDAYNIQPPNRVYAIAISPLGPGPVNGKTLGDSGCEFPNCVGQAVVGEPISVENGNMYEHVTDYKTAGPNPLEFARYYNSLGTANGIHTYASTLGTNWRSTYDRYLRVGSTRVTAERADGQQLTFTSNSGAWTSDSDVDVTLTQSGSTWTLTDHDDTVETYITLSSGEGLLQSIEARNGYAQHLAYNDSNQMISVTDGYSRSLNFTYNGNDLLETITTPDSLVLSYAETAEANGYQLTSVSYNTSPATSQTYLYESSAFPFELTGITDEDGNRYATWTYGTDGRATSSQLGMVANLTSVAYNSDGSATVTGALGITDTYTFTQFQGVPKVTQISRAATATTTAATATFTYDSNGYLSSRTDWDGNQTTQVNDPHGDPTTINEAVGTSAARITTIAYDATWIHLPASVTTSGVTTTYTYDTNGEALTKTLTDTTTATTPYSTNGKIRTWTNTWSNSLLASVQSPNGNTTKYGYDSTSALTSTTDALGHVTNITSHTGGGLPLSIVDSNNVTTTLTYDPRQRLTGSTVSGTTGTYTTSWSYDRAGNLITTTLPDNSFLTNAYDTAHRLIKVTDALGNYTSYTLDALGDRTQTSISTKGGTITWQRSGTFDALGRLLVDTAGAGQTTTRTFDPNGNVLTVEDGLSHTTTNTYDALNRLGTSTDANGGMTTPAYDTHNRLVSVQDANGNTTAYIRDGFGDAIQQSSPDSGVTVFHYDGDANLTSKTDARKIVANQTFDPLDRPLTTTYPADAAENVSYTYDQTGTGFAFGIDRLTSVADAAGSLTRQYEERGDLANETRVNGTTSLSTSYAYDGANRLASMTYPDATQVAYHRDAAGYITKVTAQLPGTTAVTTVATMTHLPFGPLNGATYGNGVAETWAFDKDYRATSVADALSGTNLQNLSYVYDSADNITSIVDGVNPANGQTLGYDPINRLTSATSGSGGYGSFAWTLDKVGNWLSQVQGSITTTYGYTSGTNRLVSITAGTTSASLRLPSRPHIHNEPDPMLSARISPAGKPGQDAAQPIAVAKPANISFAVLGWPMLFAGIAGIVGFRKRLFRNRLFGGILFAMLTTGSVRLLIGCGGGSGGGSGSQPPQPTPTAATPVFMPAAGSYTAAQSITISDTTSGASIYYTTDGTTPSSSSTKYASPVSVSASETLIAIAIASGYTNSTEGQAAYKISLPIAGPVASDASGNITSLPVSVTAASPAFTDAERRAWAAMASDITATANFTYNNANRLATVSGTPVAASFVYDWAGQRYSKTDTGMPATVYSYMQGGTLIAENDNGTVTDYIYADGRPIAVLQPGATTTADQVNYVYADRLGTPQVVSNSGGTTVWSTSYQPYGTTSTINAAINQNLRLPGQNFDAESSFNYNLNRDYVQYLGRYLESDPIGLIGGVATYDYASDNPLKFRDNLGLFPFPPELPVVSQPNAPATTSPQKTQTILNFLKNHFLDFGGNPGPAEGAVDEAASIGNAVAQCPRALSQAYTYYHNPTAPFDPNKDYSEAQTTPPENPNVDFLNRLLIRMGLESDPDAPPKP